MYIACHAHTRREMKIAIVTDDLTSATDGAVGFAERGWSAQVIRGTRISTALESADLVSVDAASRSCPREGALRRVTAAGLAVAPAAMVLKQFDSTLRGYIAAETLALLRATRRERVIVAPAFPAAGRTTINARQFVHGVPVDVSSYASDPLNPVRSNNLRALFEQEGVEVGRRETDRCLVFVLDAETEADLTSIASQYIGRTDLVLAGSTGLMRSLARVSGQRAHGQQVLPPCRRVLIVVGSLNPQSREQLDALQFTNAPILTLTSDIDPTSMAADIGERFHSADVITVTTSTARADPLRVAQRLGHVVAYLIRQELIDALIVTGGHTLASILERLGSDSLTVCREIEPGIPLCLVNQPRALPLISKAGGFGSPDIFLKAVRALRGMDRENAQ